MNFLVYSIYYIEYFNQVDFSLLSKIENNFQFIKCDYLYKKRIYQYFTFYFLLYRKNIIFVKY